MCPGLTSPGAKLFPADVDTVVVSFYTCKAQFYTIKYICEIAL